MTTHEQFRRMTTSMASARFALHTGRTLRLARGAWPKAILRATEPVDGPRPDEGAALDFDPAKFAALEKPLPERPAPEPFVTLADIKARFRWTDEDVAAARRAGFPASRRSRQGRTSPFLWEALWQRIDIDGWAETVRHVALTLDRGVTP